MCSEALFVVYFYYYHDGENMFQHVLENYEQPIYGTFYYQALGLPPFLIAPTGVHRNPPWLRREAPPLLEKRDGVSSLNTMNFFVLIMFK